MIQAFPSPPDVDSCTLSIPAGPGDRDISEGRPTSDAQGNAMEPPGLEADGMESPSFKRHEACVTAGNVGLGTQALREVGPQMPGGRAS